MSPDFFQVSPDGRLPTTIGHPTPGNISLALWSLYNLWNHVEMLLSNSHGQYDRHHTEGSTFFMLSIPYIKTMGCVIDIWRSLLALPTIWKFDFRMQATHWTLTRSDFELKKIG